MINNLEPYLTYENIYLVANWGVIPFWLMLIFIPNNGVTKFFVHSVVTPLLLGFAYVYIGYKIYLEGSIYQYITFIITAIISIICAKFFYKKFNL